MTDPNNNSPNDNMMIINDLRNVIKKDKNRFFYDNMWVPSPATSGKEKGPAKKEEIDTIQYPEEEINPDDIPF